MPSEPLKTYFQVTIMNKGYGGDKIAINSEEEALQEALAADGAYRYFTELTEVFEGEASPVEGCTTLQRLDKDNEFWRIHPPSHNRFVNFNRTYSLTEVIAEVEASLQQVADMGLFDEGYVELGDDKLVFERDYHATTGQLEAYKFIANLLEGAENTIEPTYLKMDDHRFCNFYPLSEGEKVYDSRGDQVWPKPAAPQP